MERLRNLAQVPQLGLGEAGMQGLWLQCRGPLAGPPVVLCIQWLSTRGGVQTGKLNHVGKSRGRLGLMRVLLEVGGGQVVMGLDARLT